MILLPKIILRLLLTVLLAATVWSNAFSQRDDLLYLHGKKAFQTNCSPCHSIHKEIVGPSLASITKKRDLTWLVQFIRNSQNIISTGDPYATFLFEQYHHQVMPSFENLPEDEIRNILVYIKEESLNDDEDPRDDLDPLERGDAHILHGKQLFQQQCAFCHFIHHEDDDAPSLGSISKRRPRVWISAFIHNSQKVIKSGDPYAEFLFKSFDGAEMVPMEFLSENEISDILTYITFSSSSGSATGGVNGRKNLFREGNTEIHLPLSTEPISGKSFLIVVVLTAVLSGFTIYIILITKILRYLNQGDSGN